MPNKHILEGFQCPKCNSEGPFQIEITTTFLVYDSGVDEQTGDNEWSETSWCRCEECGQRGTVATFRI